MSLVGFKNLNTTTTVEFIPIEDDYLMSSVRKFAVLQEDDGIYNQIMREKVSLSINGEVIHPDDWLFYEVEEDDEILITPVLGGSDMGAALQMIAAVVLIALSFVPGFQPLAPIGIELAAGTLFVAGVALALGGISWFLFRPDLPVASYSGSSTSSSQTYNWSGIQTTARYDSPIPVLYGTHALGGNIISGFIESQGSYSYLNMLVAFCEGEIDGICQDGNISSICLTSDPSSSDYRTPAITIDDQPIQNYDAVQWWYRTGSNVASPSADQYYPFAQNIIPFFNGSFTQHDDGREVTNSNGGIIYSTTTEVDSVSLIFKIPALYKADEDDSEFDPAIIAFYVYYKVTGEEDWIPLTANKYITNVTRLSTFGNPTTVRARFLDYTYRYGSDVRDKYNIEIVSSTYREPKNDWYKYDKGMNWDKNVPYDVTIKVTNIGDNTSYTKTVTNYQRLYFKTSIAMIPNVEQILSWFVVGEFEIAIYGPTATVGSQYRVNTTLVETENTKFRVRDYSFSNIWETVTVDFNQLGEGKNNYDIKIQRLRDASNTSGRKDTMYLNSVVEKVNGEFIYPNTALLGLRIKATNQLSGNVPTIITKVRGKKVSVPQLVGKGESQTFDDYFWTDTQWEDVNGSIVTWDNSTYTATEYYTDNSILCIRDMILNSRYGLGEYLTTKDIYTSGAAIAVKECWKEYNVNSENVLSWWTGGTDTDWLSQIISSGYYPTTITPDINTISSSNRKIIFEYSGSFYNIFMNIKLSEELTIGKQYTFSITYANIERPIRLSIYVVFRNNTRRYIDSDLIVFSDGEKTISFECTESDIVGLYVENARVSTSEVIGVGGDPNDPTHIEITNISMEGTSNIVPYHYHTYNGVFDSIQAALTALLETCDSFRCWPVWRSGQFDFIIDKDDTPVHAITKGNMYEFSQTFSPLSELPYKIIGQYTDKNYDYNLTSLIARSTDQSLTKINEVTIGLKGVTDRKRAERELKFKLNRYNTGVHAISFKCGIDVAHAVAGDVIYVQSDVPQWGQGGRILSYNQASNLITIDDEYTFDYVASTHRILYRVEEDEYVTATLDTASFLDGDSTQELKVLNWVGSPINNAVYSVGLYDNLYKKFRIVSAERTETDEVSIAAINHVSSIYQDEDVITFLLENNKLSTIVKKPEPPVNIEISTVNRNSGIGVILNAYPASGDTNVTQIAVYMRKTPNENINYSSYSLIGYIPVGVGYMTYINSNLMFETSYDFKFVSITSTGIESQGVIVSYTLSYTNYVPPAPTGLKLKGYDANDIYFYGRDVCFQWNPVTIGSSSTNVTGYQVEIWNAERKTFKLLRSVFCPVAEYTYTYENNVEDNGGFPIYAIAVYVKSVMYTDTMSEDSAFMIAINTAPRAPGAISVDGRKSSVGGVTLELAESEEIDHKNYVYQVAVGTGDYSATWIPVETNAVTYTLTATDIDTYGKTPVVSILIKDEDWYGQRSATLEATIVANVVADTVFGLSLDSNASVTSASLLELIDGTINSGGVTF